jgi:hypothetical protein
MASASSLSWDDLVTVVPVRVGSLVLGEDMGLLVREHNWVRLLGDYLLRHRIKVVVKVAERQRVARKRLPVAGHATEKKKYLNRQCHSKQ